MENSRLGAFYSIYTSLMVAALFSIQQGYIEKLSQPIETHKARPALEQKINTHTLYEPVIHPIFVTTDKKDLTLLV